MSSEVKPFLTFDKQVEYLSNKGLKIEDAQYAKSILSNVNYYRFINAYSLGLYENNTTKSKYKDGTTFSQIYDLYQFDIELRHIMADLLEEFEIIFRTKLAYYIGKNYGALGYLNSDMFENKDFHNEMLIIYNREKQNQCKSKIVKHHEDKYDGNIPIWAAVEIFSFGTVSKMYANMKPSDRSYIAKELGTSYPYLNSWLRAFVETRNICAHYGRLYNKQLLSPPRLYPESSFGNSYIFAVLYTLKRFLTNEKWIHIYTRIRAAFARHICVELKKVGFPKNWEELLE